MKQLLLILLLNPMLLLGLDEYKTKSVTVNLDNQNPEIKFDQPQVVNINNNNISTNITDEQAQQIALIQVRLEGYYKCQKKSADKLSKCLNDLEGQQFKDSLTQINEGERAKYVLRMIVPRFEEFLKKFKTEAEWQKFRNNLSLDHQKLVPATLAGQKKLLDECRQGKLSAIGNIIKIGGIIIGGAAFVVAAVILSPFVLLGMYAEYQDMSEQIRRQKIYQAAASVTVGTTALGASCVASKSPQFKTDDNEKLQQNLAKTWKPRQD